jgi:ribosomal protein S18 acetylase RimI-like enzyme
MVQWVIDESRRRRRRRIRIHTLESMPGAQRLYERIGFVRTPEYDENWDGIIGLAFVLELGPAAV